MKDSTNLVLTFSYRFMESENTVVYFAFSYPYSYNTCQCFLSDLNEQFKSDADIYYHQEELVHTPLNRIVNLITISNHEHKTDSPEDYFSESLFPNKVCEKRAVR